MKKAIEKYKTYLVIERELAINSIEAYITDIKKFIEFCATKNIIIPERVTSEVLNDYLAQLKSSIVDRTEARIISSIRSFFKYLLIEGLVSENPAKQLKAPKFSRRRPTILSREEIDTIMQAVEMYKPEGQRNKAIIEILYSCGLRVSELINIKLSNINLRMGTVKIEGKGNKDRVVPLNPTAKIEVKQYLKVYRNYLDINDKCQDILFLNKHGATLSRVIVFNIIKHLAQKADIKKNVSPHTFRHSFASHLLSNGVDLKKVQDMLGNESISTTEIYIRKYDPNITRPF